jgi:hypothetical protein
MQFCSSLLSSSANHLLGALVWISEVRDAVAATAIGVRKRLGAERMLDQNSMRRHNRRLET